MTTTINPDDEAQTLQFGKPVTLQIITPAGGIIQTVLLANTEIRMIKPENGWDVKIDFLNTDDLLPVEVGSNVSEELRSISRQKPGQRDPEYGDGTEA